MSKGTEIIGTRHGLWEEEGASHPAFTYTASCPALPSLTALIYGDGIQYAWRVEACNKRPILCAHTHRHATLPHRHPHAPFTFPHTHIHPLPSFTSKHTHVTTPTAKHKPIHPLKHTHESFPQYTHTLTPPHLSPHANTHITTVSHTHLHIHTHTHHKLSILKPSTNKDKLCRDCIRRSIAQKGHRRRRKKRRKCNTRKKKSQAY